MNSLSNRGERVLIIASVRRDRDVEWVKSVVDRHSNPWLVLDQKSAEILARVNILSQLSPDRIIVSKGRRPEELALKIYKVVTPDLVYICDKYNVLKTIADLFRVAPVEVNEC